MSRRDWAKKKFHQLDSRTTWFRFWTFLSALCRLCFALLFPASLLAPKSNFLPVFTLATVDSLGAYCFAVFNLLCLCCSFPLPFLLPMPFAFPRHFPRKSQQTLKTRPLTPSPNTYPNPTFTTPPNLQPIIIRRQLCCTCVFIPILCAPLCVFCWLCKKQLKLRFTDFEFFMR